MSNRKIEPTLDIVHGGLCHINSQENAYVKLLKSLLTKKGRADLGLFMIEGLKIYSEARNCNAAIEITAVSESFLNSAQGLKIDAAKLICIKDSIFKTLSDTESPQGLIAAVRIQDKKEDEKKFSSNSGGIYLILDEIQDPGNLGTILRTADAAGVSGIALVKGCADIYSPKVVRSTMGSIFRVPTVHYESAAEAVKFFKGNGVRVFSSSLEGGINYTSVDFCSSGIAISIGNESNGVSKELMEASDGLIRIPMPGGAESLNAAVAAAVLVYEALRQRNSGIERGKFDGY